MDRNEKLLKKLSQKEFLAVMVAIEKILQNDIQGLNIRKLSGKKDLFRARIGKIRIIFLKYPSDIEILDISRRSEKTYKDF